MVMLRMSNYVTLLIQAFILNPISTDLIIKYSMSGSILNILLYLTA